MTAEMLHCCQFS